MKSEYTSLGMDGIKEISGTSAVLPDGRRYFCAFKALNGDAVIDEIAIDGTTITTNITVKEGVEIIVGRCTSIKLASGYGWGYQKELIP